MAEPGATADDDDYDVKDEELVDFEGSDYGFESGGEEEVVETTTATIAQPPFPVDDAETAKAQEDVTSPKVVKVVVGDSLKLHKHPKPDLEDGELDDAAMVIIHSLTLPIRFQSSLPACLRSFVSLG